LLMPAQIGAPSHYVSTGHAVVQQRRSEVGQIVGVGRGRARNIVDGDVEGVEEATARWRERAAAGGVGQEQGMERIDPHEVRADLRCLVAEVPQVAEVPDAPVPSGPQLVELASDAPDRGYEPVGEKASHALGCLESRDGRGSGWCGIRVDAKAVHDQAKARFGDGTDTILAFRVLDGDAMVLAERM
jgi:hypothetical protein